MWGCLLLKFAGIVERLNMPVENEIKINILHTLLSIECKMKVAFYSTDKNIKNKKRAGLL